MITSMSCQLIVSLIELRIIMIYMMYDVHIVFEFFSVIAYQIKTQSKSKCCPRLIRVSAVLLVYI